MRGLNQIQKRIQNLLENGYEKLEKEKEKDFPHPFGFSPVSWPGLIFLRSPAARDPFSFPRIPLGPSPANGLTRACLPFFSLSLSDADAAGPRIRDAFFLPTPASDFFPCSPLIESASPIPSFLV
jgi:hypothetical protein